MELLPAELPDDAQRRAARLYRESRVRAEMTRALRDGRRDATREGYGPRWAEARAKLRGDDARYEQDWLARMLGEVVTDWAMVHMSEHRGSDAEARRTAPASDLLVAGSRLGRITFATPELAVAAVAAGTRRAAATLPGTAFQDPLLARGVWMGLTDLVDADTLSLARTLVEAGWEMGVADLIGNARAILGPTHAGPGSAAPAAPQP